MAIERNYDKIQFEKYRRVVDPKFNQLHDKLTNCYYSYWKKGLSKPFQGYDKQSNLKDSKILFDKLHGLIFEHHLIEINEEHERTLEKDQYPKFEESLKITNELNEVIGNRITLAQSKINEQALVGVTIAWE